MRNFGCRGGFEPGGGRETAEKKMMNMELKTARAVALVGKRAIPASVFEMPAGRR